MNEPTWAKRNVLLDQFELEDCSVVDFGCGDKSVLNYQTFREYIGLDRAATADIQIDFDIDTITLDKHYDVGLVLGVLEYIKDPTAFVRAIRPFADRFIIMVLARDVPKPEWKHAFTQESISTLLSRQWSNCKYINAGGYIIADCSNKPAHCRDGLDKFLQLLPSTSTILDIGAGKLQPHANVMRAHGHIVDTSDFHSGATYKGDFNTVTIDKKYNAVWSAMSLEHQLNVNRHLTKINSILNPNGVLCVTVPTLKSNIVSGHVTLWNAGLLLYNLVLAGFDCSKAKIKTYGYNITVILTKQTFNMPALNYDKPDLTTLKSYFPESLTWDLTGKGFEGNIKEINWK